eukprot:CAMPEP_0185793400 /NCGR_PEP_ID=MMETSP1174-20130828/159449_1 /TAXON_ID=35687 /ORGANISM="Dictyocha speculum, Strain CCMP1381" /LENGTH=144 /DNA_ID=CAMNT_0028488535 /DNA_START=516 /DNA_END=950 /DNA_ORIENTATION=+
MPQRVGGSKYRHLIVEAFAAKPELDGGLTKGQIVDTIVALYPEYSKPEQRRLLVNGVGTSLNKRGEKIPDTGKVNVRDIRWTLPAEFSSAQGDSRRNSGQAESTSAKRARIISTEGLMPRASDCQDHKSKMASPEEIREDIASA